MGSCRGKHADGAAREARRELRHIAERLVADTVAEQAASKQSGGSCLGKGFGQSEEAGSEGSASGGMCNYRSNDIPRARCKISSTFSPRLRTVVEERHSILSLASVSMIAFRE